VAASFRNMEAESRVGWRFFGGGFPQKILPDLDATEIAEGIMGTGFDEAHFFIEPLPNPLFKRA